MMMMMMMMFPNRFLSVTQNRTPTLGRYTPITHEQQYFFTEMPIYSGCTPN